MEHTEGNSMSENNVIEASENLKGETIITVQTKRGREYVINQDVAAREVARILCDIANERHFGWDLADSWFRAELELLLARSAA